MTAPDRGATYQIALASTGSSTHEIYRNGEKIDCERGPRMTMRVLLAIGVQ